MYDDTKMGASGGSGLGGCSGDNMSPVNVLDPLLVPVQDEDRGAAGAEHGPQREDIKE